MPPAKPSLQPAEEEFYMDIVPDMVPMDRTERKTKARPHLTAEQRKSMLLEMDPVLGAVPTSVPGIHPLLDGYNPDGTVPADDDSSSDDELPAPSEAPPPRPVRGEPPAPSEAPPPRPVRGEPPAPSEAPPPRPVRGAPVGDVRRSSTSSQSGTSVGPVTVKTCELVYNEAVPDIKPRAAYNVTTVQQLGSVSKPPLPDKLDGDGAYRRTMKKPSRSMTHQPQQLALTSC